MSINIKIVSGSSANVDQLVDAQQFSIGRGENVDLCLDDRHLSEEHIQIFVEGDSYIARDLRSTNGTQLERNGQRRWVDARTGWEVSLRTGDRLIIGDPEDPIVLQVEITGESSDSKEFGDSLVASRSIIDLPALTSRLHDDPVSAAMVYRAFAPLGSQTTLAGTLTVVAEAAFSLLPRATHVSIMLRSDPDHERFSLVHSQLRGKEKEEEVLTRASHSLVRKVLKDKAGFVTANAQNESNFEPSASIVASRIISVLAVPLWVEDEIHGVLQADTQHGSGMFSPQDLELALLLASQGALAIEKARLVEKLQEARKILESENHYLRGQAAPKRFDSLIGAESGLKGLVGQLKKVINTRATVLITGETGTGKELVAQAIHYESERRDKMFVAQNCATLSESLLESELFGHRKGSFTGADTDKKGLFQVADGGTLFLDEIGEMPLSLQAKLLRVLQEGRFRPVGATNEVPVDVRIVCATHRDLLGEVSAGNFREDLYYRLAVFPLEIPPLRQRKEDIPLLTQHFLEKYSAAFRTEVPGLSTQCIAGLMGYSWPGNIRELENEIQRLIIQSEPGEEIHVTALSPRIAPRRSDKVGEIKKGVLKEMVGQFEKSVILSVLEEHGGNKTQAAKSLGITREGLHKKLAKFNI